MAAGLANVFCPDGARTTGAGASLSDSNGRNSWLNGIFPLDRDTLDDPDAVADDGASAEAWNAGTKPRTLTVFAICSRGSDSGDQTYASTTENASGATVQYSGNILCPGGDEEVTLGGGIGNTRNQFQHLASSGTDGTYFWEGGSHGDGSGPAWQMRFHAICLPADSRNVIAVKRFVSFAPGEIRSKTVACPRGKRVTGGGGGLGATSELLISRPFDGPDRDRVPDDGWS